MAANRICECGRGCYGDQCANCRRKKIRRGYRNPNDRANSPKVVGDGEREARIRRFAKLAEKELPLQ